jgi:hypothetical protein
MCKIAPNAADFDCPELERAVERSRCLVLHPATMPSCFPTRDITEISSMPGTYDGTVDEWLPAGRRSAAGIARLFSAPAAAVDFPAGQRGDLWATAQHIVGTVNRWFYSSAVDGITPSAEFVRFVTERRMTSGHDADPVMRSTSDRPQRSRRHTTMISISFRRAARSSSSRHGRDVAPEPTSSIFRLTCQPLRFA